MGFESIKLMSPVLIIFATSMVVLVLGIFFRSRHFLLPLTSLIGVVLSWISILWIWSQKQTVLFQGGVVVDSFGLLMAFLIGFAIFLALLMSQGYAHKVGYESGEYYGLILMAGGAMMVMAMSTHLITLFVALETFSIGVYALVGLVPGDKRSKEGSLKYFVLGSFASAFLLYGMSLLYGATGSLDLASPAFALREGSAMFLLGLGLITFGLAFKIGAIPFHWWVPDAYEGAPTPITGYMATAVKIAAFGFAGRLALHLFRLEWIQEIWMPVIWVLAVVTMLFGSILALLQQNLKRLLAYSSIVHGGYLLIALYVMGAGADESAQLSTASMLFYLAVYTVLTMGAFGVMVAAASQDGKDREDLASYQGLGFTSPKLALALSIFLLALAGIPPTAGFMGKFYIFKGAIQSGSYWLGALGILGSLISLYYYLKVIVVMYMKEEEEETVPSLEPWGAKCVLAISLVLTFVLGLLPGAYFELSSRSVALFFGH